MKSLADALPPEIAQRIDPAWRRNEAACRAVCDHLLAPYRGPWVGFADLFRGPVGKVIVNP